MLNLENNTILFVTDKEKNLFIYLANEYPDPAIKFSAIQIKELQSFLNRHYKSKKYD